MDHGLKKLSLILMFLGVSVSAHATVLDLPSFISGADVTISALNTLSTNTENWANGNVEGGSVNIKAGSIVSIDLNTSVSPITRWSETFSDYTSSGQLPATSANLTSDISAGVSYVNGYRCATNTTSHTYSASKDTWVYIHEGGYFIYVEVSNGGTQPPTPSDSLLLATVVTSGTAITSVNDLRSTSVQITSTTTNFPLNFRDQAYVSLDTTATMHVEPGSVAIGTTIYSRVSDTSSRNIATGTNWIEASKPFSAGKIYVYAYNEGGTSFDFKYSSADPVYSDTSSNTAGVLRYYTSGGTTYRAIGWAYMSADAIQTYAFGNFSDMGVKNKVVRQFSTYASLGTGNVVVDNTPPLITEGNPIPLMDVNFVPSDPNATIKITAKANLSTSSTNNISLLCLFKDSETSAVQTAPQLTTTDYPIGIDLVYFVTAGNRTARRYSFRTGSLGGRESHLNGISGTGALFGGASVSSVEIEEIPS